MAYMPDADNLWWEALLFATAPVSTPFALAYAATYYTVGSPYGSPDVKGSLRNTALWGAMGAASWATHAWLHPGQYQWVSPAKAFEIGSKFVPAYTYAPAVLATVPVALYSANKLVIESAPQHQQQPLWQGFAQALTGTGPGVGGWEP